MNHSLKQYIRDFIQLFPYKGLGKFQRAKLRCSTVTTGLLRQLSQEH